MALTHNTEDHIDEKKRTLVRIWDRESGEKTKQDDSKVQSWIKRK